MEILPLEKVKKILVFEDSYTRLPKLLSLRLKMEQKTWLSVLGELWTAIDNLSEHKDELKTILAKNGPLAEMMTKDEQALYETFPEVLEVYRGCGPDNRNGVSWSLDKEVARKFPFLNHYKQVYPAVITGTVKKKNILAVKLDRDEKEIISFKVKETGIDMIYTNPLTNEPVTAYEK